MTENKPLLVINAIINKVNMAEVQSYIGNMMPIFVKNGGTPVGRFKTIEQLAGEQGPEMVVIFQFSDATAIKEMVNGEAFKGLAENRAKAFSKLNMMICGEM